MEKNNKKIQMTVKDDKKHEKESSSIGIGRTDWKTRKGWTSIKKKKEHLQKVNQTWLKYAKCLIIKFLPVHRSWRWRHQKNPWWLKDSGWENSNPRWFQGRNEVKLKNRNRCFLSWTKLYLAIILWKLYYAIPLLLRSSLYVKNGELIMKVYITITF